MIMKKQMFPVLCLLSLSVSAQQAPSAEETRYIELSKKYLNAAQGGMDPESLKFIGVHATQKKDRPLALRASNEYVHYLRSLDAKVAFTKENIEPVLAMATLGSDSDAFKLVYYHRYQVDQVLGLQHPVFASYSASLNVLDWVIGQEMASFGAPLHPLTKEVLFEEAKNKSEPDWTKLRMAIDKKYGSAFADRIVATTKAMWYQKNVDQLKDKTGFCTSISDVLRSYGGELSEHNRNNLSFDLFKHCGNPEQLTPAIEWMTVHIWNREGREKGKSDNDMDTLGNLLYRAKRRQEAIMWLETALSSAKANGVSGDWTNGYEKTLAKMMAGTPTWTKE
jgi:hypothetical protein